MGFAPFSTSMLQKVADTGTAGFALQNATPNILTWTAPDDGAQHPFLIMASVQVTAAETGGAVGLTFPLGGIFTPDIPVFAGSVSTNDGTVVGGVADPNTTIYLKQTTALTAGAATVYAQIWAS